MEAVECSDAAHQAVIRELSSLTQRVRTNAVDAIAVDSTGGLRDDRCCCCYYCFFQSNTLGPIRYALRVF